MNPLSISPRVERSEMLCPGPALELAMLLGLPDRLPDGEAALPPLWHWMYLPERPNRSDVGEDGLPTHGSLVPSPSTGSRRLLAGGTVELVSALRIGHSVTRRSVVAGRQTKTGRSGRLVFTTIVHEFVQNGRICIRERQDVVDVPPRSAGAGEQGARPTEMIGPDRTEVSIDPVLLFRFSAAAGVSHRIHWDEKYAQEVEGYPGLVVQGPLQTILMAEGLRTRRQRTPRALDYRYLAPLIANRRMFICWNGAEAYVQDGTGRRTAWVRVHE
ncbi:hypothetical protein ACFVKB_41910 [Rhodococcus sp. NPDC127530]|uniref:hypothetical protein n=1 Tax=unclassified Rhodococcus (in: high G+C Gram-positive bacteria) TaxID=192944 RepID=UPI003637DAB2